MLSRLATTALPQSAAFAHMFECGLSPLETTTRHLMRPWAGDEEGWIYQGGPVTTVANGEEGWVQENAGFAGAEAVRDANWDSGGSFGGEDGAGAGGGGGWEIASGGLPRDGDGQWAIEAPEFGRSWEDEGWEDDPGEWAIDALPDSVSLRVS